MLCCVELQRIVLFRLVGRLNLNAGTSGTLLDVDNLDGNILAGHDAFHRLLCAVLERVALDLRRVYFVSRVPLDVGFVALVQRLVPLVNILDRQLVGIDRPFCCQRMIIRSLYDGVFCDLVITQIPAHKGMMGAGRSRQVAVRSIKGDFLARLADRSVVRVGVEGHGVGVRFPLGS